MKTTNKYSILQTIPMVIQMLLMCLVPFAVFLSFAAFGSQSKEVLTGSLVAILLIVGSATVAGVVAAIVSIVGAISAKGNPPVYATLAVKLLSLPFYLVAGAMWLLGAGGMFNPFLMIGIPLELAMAVGCTYVYMIGTSIPLIVYAIVFTRKYKRKVSASLILAVVFLFLLVFDYVGLIIYLIKYKEWFPERYPPVSEEQKKRIRTRIVASISAFVLIVAVLFTSFRFSPRGAALCLYSEVVSIVRENDLPGVTDFDKDENGYVIEFTYSGEFKRHLVVGCYNDFIEEHPYYAKRMGTVTFVFYPTSESNRDEEPVVIVTDGTRISEV